MTLERNDACFGSLLIFLMVDQAFLLLCVMSTPSMSPCQDFLRSSAMAAISISPASKVPSNKGPGRTALGTHHRWLHYPQRSQEYSVPCIHGVCVSLIFPE